MGKPESRVENRLRKRVKEEGFSIRKVRWIGRRGAADNLVWSRFPLAAFVECKAEGEDVDWRSQQGRELRRAADDGWPVFVVNDFEGVEEVITFLKTGGCK